MLYPRSSIPLLLGFGSGPMFSNPRSTLMEDDGEGLAVWLLWCVPCDAPGPCSLVADIPKLGIDLGSTKCFLIAMLAWVGRSTIGTSGRSRLL
jgi:hypothetical protein